MQAKDERSSPTCSDDGNYHRGPIAIRYPRGAGTGAVPKEHPQIRRRATSEVLRHGRRALLIGFGNMVEMAEKPPTSSQPAASTLP